MFNSGWSRKSANPAVSLKYKQLVNEAYATSCLPLPSMTTQLHCFQKKRKKKENTVGVEGPHNHRIVWSRGGSFQRGRERRREWKHHKTPAAVMWETVSVHLPSCSPPASPHLSFFSSSHRWLYSLFGCKLLEEEFKNKPKPMFILDATCLSWPHANFQRPILEKNQSDNFIHPCTPPSP